MKGEVVRLCELCNKEANMYCESDAALLCSACDSSVHNANFLVARHVRRLICSTCSSFTGDTHSGTRSPPPPHHHLSCRSCSPYTISSSSCSSCISSTDTTKSSSTTTKISRRGTESTASSRVEGIFANWCKRLGLNGNSAVSRGVQLHGVGMCLGGLLGKRLPLRVSLAASFWLGLRMSGDSSLATCQNLRRLVGVSGVPARAIVAVELKLENVLRLEERSPEVVDLEEGWAEC